MPKNKPSPPPAGKEKTSLYLREDQKQNIRFIMYKDKTTFTEIVEELLSEYISKWEKKNGSIPK